MKRVSISTLFVLLAVAGWHAIPRKPANAQRLVRTGLNKNGLSAIALEFIRAPNTSQVKNPV